MLPCVCSVIDHRRRQFIWWKMIQNDNRMLKGTNSVILLKNTVENKSNKSKSTFQEFCQKRGAWFSLHMSK